MIIRTNNYGGTRFFVSFCLVMLITYTLVNMPSLRGWVLQPVNISLSSFSGWWIQLFDSDVLIRGDVLSLPGFAVRIADMCNGVEATLLLCSGMLCFPAPWIHKIKGMVIGAAAIYCLNTIRIISLLYLGRFNRVWFDWMHLYVWDVVLIVYILTVFLVWIQLIPKRVEGSSP